jgi:hypothetical protein
MSTNGAATATGHHERVLDVEKMGERSDHRGPGQHSDVAKASDAGDVRSRGGGVEVLDDGNSCVHTRTAPNPRSPNPQWLADPRRERHDCEAEGCADGPETQHRNAPEAGCETRSALNRPMVIAPAKAP